MDILTVTTDNIPRDNDVVSSQSDFNNVIDRIDNSLSILRQMALNTNFANKEERQGYTHNVLVVRHLFEVAERLALNETRQ